jgi:hypothetical protein
MTLIEMLRANGSWQADAAAAKIARLEVALEETGNALLSQIETSSELADRVVKLEAALREIATPDWIYDAPGLRDMARKALEGKDD